MRAARAIPDTVRPEFAVSTVTCWDDHTGWSEPRESGGYRIVLVRQGRFRRLAAGATADIDATVGYLSTPGEVEQFAHPRGGDDRTAVDLSPGLWQSLAGDGVRLTRSIVYVDAHVELAHRRMLAAPDIDFARTEHLLTLLAAAVRQSVAGLTPVHVRATPSDSALVAAAREAIADDEPAAGGLLTLAELLGVSPYRLSRAFPRELGVSLTHYRNRVRVARALDRLTAGEANLSALAGDLGFADHAHLSRTMREHLGRTPSTVRTLLHRHAT